MYVYSSACLPASACQKKYFSTVIVVRTLIRARVKLKVKRHLFFFFWFLSLSLPGVCLLLRLRKQQPEYALRPAARTPDYSTSSYAFTAEVSDGRGRCTITKWTGPVQPVCTGSRSSPGWE